MVLDAIAYHRVLQLLRIVDNQNSNIRISEVLEPEVVPFLQGIPAAILQQDIACIYVARNV